MSIPRIDYQTHSKTITIIINFPPGGKPRQRFEGFLKNVVFAIAKLLIHAPKLAQNSPGF